MASERFRNGLAEALAKAKLSPVDLAWFERIKHRRYAPLPDCKLRALARGAGFYSSKDFLDWERSHRSKGER